LSWCLYSTPEQRCGGNLYLEIPLKHITSITGKREEKALKKLISSSCHLQDWKRAPHLLPVLSGILIAFFLNTSVAFK
jgi:hypothetical protein